MVSFYRGNDFTELMFIQEEASFKYKPSMDSYHGQTCSQPCMDLKFCKKIVLLISTFDMIITLSTPQPLHGDRDLAWKAMVQISSTWT